MVPAPASPHVNLNGDNRLLPQETGSKETLTSAPSNTPATEQRAYPTFQSFRSEPFDLPPSCRSAVFFSATLMLSCIFHFPNDPRKKVTTVEGK